MVKAQDLIVFCEKDEDGSGTGRDDAKQGGGHEVAACAALEKGDGVWPAQGRELVVVFAM
jgi:hypothetical protein